MLKKNFSLLAVLSALFCSTSAIAIVEILEVDREELPNLAPRPLMAQETQRVIEMLETIHFNNEEISHQEFEELISHFMKDLDYSKLYFLESHKETFASKFGTKLGFQLRDKGDLAAGFEIYSVYREIVLDRIEWIFTELDKEWDFETSDSYLYDRSEGPWPDTKEEANVLWQKRLKHELLQELMQEKEIDEARDLIKKRYNRVLRRIKEFSSSDVQEIFLTGLTQMFDPHSTFFSAETFEDFSIQMKLSLVGIGALLSEDESSGVCVIKELIPGGPAQRANELKPEDKIVAVAQGDGEPVDIVGMSLRKIVDLIRGEMGTVVNLTIIPHDGVDDTDRRVISITRDTVRINSNRSTAYIYDVPLDSEETMPIGVIDIPSFYGDQSIDENGNTVVTSVTDDVEELVMKLRDEGAQAIILDLRHNGGGLLPEAVNMTGLFIRKGPVVQVKDPYGKVWPHNDRDSKLAYTGPLAVLTSRYSASASEILAGALQNYGRAIIIGNESTHGKGTVQQVFSLENFVFKRMLNDDKAGAAKLTVRKFYLPNGFSTQRKGVIPDIQIPSVEEIIAEGEADLPNALAWDYVKPASRFVEMTLKHTFINNLQSASESRQSDLDEFDFLTKRIDWYKEREDRKEVSLNLIARKELVEKDKNFLDLMKDSQRDLAEAKFENREIKLDSVLEDEAENSKLEESLAVSESDPAATVEAATETESTSTDQPKASEAEPSDLLASDEGEPVEDSEEDEEPVPAFDIQLRESLRIMVDAIKISPNPQDWRQPASPIASKSRFESLVN